MADIIKTVFLVDDDPLQLEMFSDHLKTKSSFQLYSFPTGEAALAKFEELKPQLIFLDYELNSVDPKAKNGLTVLKEFKKVDPEVQVVMISGQEKIEIAVNVMKFGAFDYIVKSESAFTRAENAIFNIIRSAKLQSDLKFYKKLAIGFGIGLVLLFVLVVILKLLGYINPNPTFEIN
jgi:DNA-binding NtrC family response regulator